ncbi:MAG TPA: hypothetical protein VM734_00965 [Kofleriaceae bacterium]|jgi:hypothetical protein|nr:hypothetical protein [Kofleriaceae bacterium]
MRTTLAVVLGCSLAVVADARLADAQPDDAAQRKAGAEAAFRQGKDMLAKGQIEAACMAFKQSQALDPQFGTQYNLALCFEKWGRLASAWGELTELAAKDTNKPRRADAAKRARALEPRLVRLLIVVPMQVPGLTVTRDGSDVTDLIGVATPVDPGPSKLVAEAPGYQPWSFDVTLAGEGSTVTVQVGPLEKQPEPPPPPPDDDSGKAAPDILRGPIAPPPRDDGSGRRRMALIVGGAGVVALGVGAGFGVYAWSTFDDAKALCGGDPSDCRGDLDSARTKVDAARTQALISNIGFGVGAAAIVGGAILYLTAPDAEARPAGAAVTPVVGGDRAGLVLSGQF